MSPHDVAIINKYNIINPDDNPTPFKRGIMRVKTKDGRFTVIHFRTTLRKRPNINNDCYINSYDH